ncbi:SAF domain-containing protein [Nocardiopsis ansamitocini]|uniref:SAF domain-containing protein n=1 Tax=Nocardiopsis ansamitocini TaxID=1670832 RepID=A0A9W6P5K2_9ACTN|nr:SAF domain-containing protein [Nocardiopsis ansamitocini]GLU47469.1 hypothetical protein Nans01_18200 [Nocardiopsis ansamitocini]
MVETATAPTKAPRAAGAAQPVRLLGTGPRRWRWLGLGIALMAAGALVATTAVDQLDQRRQVLVADADLPAGHLLTAGDLRVADLSGTSGLSVVSGDQLEQVVGSTLTVPVAADSVLPETAVGPGSDYPESGRAVVGASLKPGRFPESLRPGAQVSVVVVSEGESGTRRGVQAYAAHLQSFTAADGGSATAELLVDAGDAGQISTAAAADGIALVQVPAGGGS